MSVKMGRIAILTSGGDAPGMNAAIRAATRTAIAAGVDVLGVRRGYQGLMEGDFAPLGARDVGGILEQAGTILESRRAPDFIPQEGRDRALGALRASGVDGLIVIGGDGSQKGANSLSQAGFPVNGVASTIDNDLYGSDITIGVDTALNVVLEAIDRLRSTASAHHRIFLVETMGRDCGYLALAAGIAGGAEAIVTPEFDLSPQCVVQKAREAHARGKRHAIVVVAEGAANHARELYQALKDDPSHGFDPRLTILGHVQRGGKPTAFDRLLATRLAVRATDLLARGRNGLLAGYCDGTNTVTPLAEVAARAKPLSPELIQIAEMMQI